MTPTTVPQTPTSSTSTPTLYDEAKAQAEAALQAQIDPLNKQIAANTSQGEADQQAALANAQALSDMLKSIGPAISNTFNTAAQQQGILGKGFSTDVQNTLTGNQSNINAMLDQISAPEGQRLDASKPQGVADVLYALGGYIPGNMFAQQGAAFAAAANMLPGTALLKGQQNAQQARLNTESLNSKVRQNIAELAGQLPGAIQDNYAALQKMALEDAKFRAQLNRDNVNAAYKQATLKLSAYKAKLAAQNQKFKQSLDTAKYKTSVAEFNIKSQQAQQRINQASQRLAQSQFNADRSYQLSLAHLGIAQKSLQMKVLAASIKEASGGLTPAALAKAQGKAFSIAQSAISKTGPNGVVGAPWQIALGSMLHNGVPVQTAVDTITREYPKAHLPTPNALELKKFLGPLAPEKLKAMAAQASPLFAKISGQTSFGITGSHAALTAVEHAKLYLGTPYLWGGTSPKGFDCSGLLQYVWKQSGVNIPRTTYSQIKAGRQVDPSQLLPGDAVFFGTTANPHHVGMYIGNGDFIEAPRTGLNVRISHLAGRTDFLQARRYG